VSSSICGAHLQGHAQTLDGALTFLPLRTCGFTGLLVSCESFSGETLEERAFKQLNGAFMDLLGRSQTLHALDEAHGIPLLVGLRSALSPMFMACASIASFARSSLNNFAGA
jgi:hypothetical protein